MRRNLFESITDIYAKAEELIQTKHVHKHRQQTIDVADFWYKMVNGLNHNDWVTCYRPSESEAQQQQRIRVYKSRTKYVLNRVRSKVKKSDRVDYTVDEIKYLGSDSETKITELKDRIGRKFHGNSDAKDYINEHYNKLNEIDPNAFIGVNFFDYDNTIERPYVYPVIIRSEDVQDWCYTNGVLDYVWFNKPVQVKCSDGKNAEKRSTDRLYFAAKRYTLVFQRIQDGEVISDDEARPRVNIQLSNGDIEVYHYEEYNHKSDQVPFHRVGYVPDPITDGETYESMYFATKEILEDLVVKKSELDVLILTHGIREKFAYVPACDHQDRHGNYCSGGVIDGCWCGEDSIQECSCKPKTCKACSGTGKKPIHQSHQDILTMEIAFTSDQQPEQFLDLDKLIHTVTFDPAIFELYVSMIKELESDVAKALFNVDVFNKDANEAKTPEAIRSQNDALNNVLFEYCTHKARMYEFVVIQTAIYMEQVDGLQCAFKPPTDFKLDTVDDLINQYNNATGLPKTVKDGILNKLYQKQNQDSPENLKMIRAREKFKPFSHMSESERLSTFDLLPEDNLQRVLWLNFDRIFCDIENAKSLTYEIEGTERSTKVAFHNIMDYDTQRSIVDKVTEKYMIESPIGIREAIGGQESVVAVSEDEASTGGSREGNSLARSVGGSSIVGAINEEVATGKLTREGGVNRAMIQLGYDRATAELLVPLPPKSVPNPDLV